MRVRNILNLILISGCLLFAGVSLSLMSPFYPSEALSKGVSVTLSGVVMGSVFISTIIFTPICGRYIDTLGARKFLLIGATVCALGNIVFGFLNKINGSMEFFGVSVLVRVVVALGESAMTPSCYTLAAQQVDHQHQGKALSLAEASFGVGTMFGPSIGGFLYEFGGFSLPFWAAGGTLFILMLISVVCLEDKTDQYTTVDGERKITWKQVLASPGVAVSVFGLVFAGSAWSWYSATLEPFLGSEYGLTSAQTGLVFTAFGASYTIFNPIFGYFSDKGMDGLSALILGNTLISLGFMFLGPIPQLSSIGGHLWLTVVSISVQGLGSAATYLGSLLYMLKGVKEAGLPETEQVKSMVSSLWIVSDCFGGYAGSTLGSIAYDNVGFEKGSLIEAILLACTVLTMAMISLAGLYNVSALWTKSKDVEAFREEKEEKRSLLGSHDRIDRVYGS